MFDYEYVLAPDLENCLKMEHISLDLAITAVRLAESSGRKFFNRKDGVYCASYCKENTTYWVHYRTDGSVCRILKLYYHRIMARRAGAE